MRLTGNTILVTGGGSGIGLGLAREFLALGNRVVIAGRRRKTLDEAVGANPGLAALTLDVEDAAGVREFAGRMAGEYPELNVLVNNAGVMRVENLTVEEPDVAAAEAIIATNLLGPLRLTAALLPVLRKQEYAAVMNVSSGLAFVPLAPTPTYCATKAALHSWTQSLRYQLKKTAVEVVELIPPYVATELMSGAADPRAMPLGEFIAEVMEILRTEPGVTEICVERAKALRFAAESGRYEGTFQGLNDAMAGAML